LFGIGGMDDRRVRESERRSREPSVERHVHRVIGTRSSNLEELTIWARNGLSSMEEAARRDVPGGHPGREADTWPSTLFSPRRRITVSR
jgi:hypothetical protein